MLLRESHSLPQINKNMISNDKYFYNWTTEDFTWKLNGQEHSFKAGSVTPMTQAEFDHFAKHLTDREMNKMDLRTNDQIKREEFLAKCNGATSIQEPVAQTVQADDTYSIGTKKESPITETEFAEISIKKWCNSCDAKGPIRHKKNCPKAKK